MTTEEALLGAVCASPADDLPRLAYADWCEENGQSERADFIRVQIELARLGEGDPRKSDLEARESALLEAHSEAWSADLPDWAFRPQFRRGFVAVVSAHAEELLWEGEALRRRAPLEGVRLRGLPDPGIVHGLFRSPCLGGLTELDLEGITIGQAGARALASSPRLARLTVLNLGHNGIGDAGAQALAESPHLANLTTLDVVGNEIGDEGARALAGSPHLVGLTSLTLANNVIGARGAFALARSQHLARLTFLQLGSNEIGDEGALALADSPHLARLNFLGLARNGVGDEVVDALLLRFGDALHL
jgi:uncharacterized protein (TIGR02996 family)